MEKQFGERLQPKLKPAILLHGMPSGVQEYVYQQMQSVGDKTDVANLKSFEDAKDIAKGFAARRAEAHGPAAHLVCYCLPLCIAPGSHARDPRVSWSSGNMAKP